MPSGREKAAARRLFTEHDTLSWPAAQLATSPWFRLLQPFLEQLAWTRFPEPADLAALPAHYLPRNRLQQVIQFVDPAQVAMGYDASIWHEGRVPTRPGNWHDLFNALCWLSWPSSKAALNALHQRSMVQDPAGRRTPLRDAATLLDESGAVLPYSDPALLHLLLEAHWQALFCEERAAWGQRIGVLPIGHALLEKGLAPYTGIVAKVMPMPVPASFFSQALSEQRLQADQWLSTQIDAEAIATPGVLPPLPVLGIPGWWPQQDSAFYEDTRHFRPKRQR